MRLLFAAPIIAWAAVAQAGVPLPPVRAPTALLRQTAGPPPDVPLPVPRPEVQGPPPSFKTEPFGPPLSLRPEPMPASPDAACSRVLTDGKIVGALEPAIVGQGGCGIASPLRLKAVVMPGGRRIPLEPPPVIRCDLAERLADWLREDVAPVVTPYGDLAGVADAAGYSCRGRNHVVGAALSEHAKGNALDIVAFRYPAHTIGLKDAAAGAFLAQVNHSACTRFSTVLGPGSDGYHEDNLHLDLEFRKNGAHYCHWRQP